MARLVTIAAAALLLILFDRAMRLDARHLCDNDPTASEAVCNEGR